MTYRFTESAWLSCEHPGCPTGTYADPRHLPNLTASGGWYCHLHERDDEVSEASA